MADPAAANDSRAQGLAEPNPGDAVSSSMARSQRAVLVLSTPDSGLLPASTQHVHGQLRRLPGSADSRVLPFNAFWGLALGAPPPQRSQPAALV